jgi:N-acetylglutamate synthase-like GNAT family acetyltransferase
MADESDYQLVEVKERGDWVAYHSIRRRELFEAKGRSNYNPHHPDEFAPHHHCLLLKYKGVGIGTTRLDVYESTEGVLRLVAITKSLQGKGRGWTLLKMVGELAQQKHCITKLLVNADPSAVGFYRKQGFQEDSWNPAELVGISANAIQMSKRLL